MLGSSMFEFKWPYDEVFQIAGPPPSVSVTQIHKASCKMNSDKDVGPSGIIAEMLKGADDEGVELERQLAEAVSVWFQ